MTRKRTRRLKAVAALSAVALAVAGCGSGASGGQAKTLTVFAAASLTESFGALEKRFEAENSGVDVKLSFDGSSKLAQQINEGAKADVFASADQNNMDKVVKADRAAGQPAAFATNRLAIAVAPGNPKAIKGFADLAMPELTVVACAPQVPCGAATDKVEQNSGVALKPKSEESDVKAVLTKVIAGEADAGLVYVTDASSAPGKVDRVDFPEAAGAVNTYPIVTVRDAPEADLARRFTEFVLGAAGREELAKVGFGAP
ncbi:molybdate ABC transporter substrate-binding protein [Amycolatopsis nigrescens]|uniref:molybdate ABC transporter substrate-binding protein n=1 Tax=Amycolatopsis nigrescens TaxID=381445 RepID=UPI00058CC619|nr:molybdate ABC transporter substrate-binding protein [Amycolatopsis nigrescens]